MWVETGESIYYVMAPAKHTNGELIDYISSYLEHFLESEDDIVIEEGSLKIKSVEFLDGETRTNTILFTEMSEAIPAKEDKEQ